MPLPPDAEPILWVIRAPHRRGRPVVVAPRASSPPSRADRANARDGSGGSPLAAIAARHPCAPGGRRLTSALFVGAASVCFAAALLTAAALHFLLIQERIGWAGAVPLVALGGGAGLAGWRMLSHLRDALRRTLGVSPDAQASLDGALTPRRPAPPPGSDPGPRRRPRGSRC